MEFVTIQKTAIKWGGISPKRIQTLYALPQVIKFSRQWAIPTNSSKTMDVRIKNKKNIRRGL